MTPETFITTYLPYAETTEKETGISAAFVLAQAALESGWGKHAPGFNFFGVKAGPGWKGLTQLLTTREVHTTATVPYPVIVSIVPRQDGRFSYTVKDRFRAYRDAAEAFTDHARFFLANRRYHQALEVKGDPEAFARGVAKAGYATDPMYERSLVSIIRKITAMTGGQNHD